MVGIYKSLNVLVGVFLACAWAMALPVLGQAEVAAADEIAPPAQVAELLTPRQLDPKEEADRLLSWKAARAGIEVVLVKPKEEVDPATPPVAAVAALVKQSDGAMAQGETYRAIELLREAEQLSPNHPDLVRRLGLAYSQSGNLTRGAVYLRRTLERDPSDALVLLMLARQAISAGELGQAVGLCEALSAQGQGALADYYLFEALSARGYDLASVERLSDGLDAVTAIEIDDKAIADPTKVALRRELRVLAALEPELRLRAGDLLLALGQFDAASAEYGKVAVQGTADTGGLVARRVYLALRKGQQPQALDQVIDLLSSKQGAIQHGALVGYLAEQGVGANTLADRFAAVIAEQGATVPLLAGLAQVPDKVRVVEVALGWLANNPGKFDMLGKTVSLVPFDDMEPADARPLALLLTHVADQMREDPVRAQQYLQVVLKDVDALVCLLRAVKQPAFTDTQDPYRLLLAGYVYEHTGRDDDAIQQYRALIEKDTPTAEQARLPIARILLNRNKPQEAIDVLGEVRVDSSWEQLSLTARAMGLAGDRQSALALIEGWEQREGATVASSLIRIDMFASVISARKASEQLLKLIDENPRDEQLYNDSIDLIFSLFDSERINQPVASSLYQQVLDRLERNLPNSVTVRLNEAKRIYLSLAQTNQAEQLLLSVVEDEPDNALAWYMLKELYEMAGDPVSEDRAFEQYVLVGESGLTRALARARRAASQGEMERAMELLNRVTALEEEGVLPGPAMDGDSAGSLLHLLHVADPEADLEAMELALVLRFPDSPMLNNGVGYQWSVQGKKLLQAKVMIERALDTDPDEYIYIDSLAWVQYKLGDFDAARASQEKAILLMNEDWQETRRGRSADTPEAVAELQEASFRATKAVFLDHLGDILFMQGQARGDEKAKHSATRMWQIAQADASKFTQEQTNTSVELRDLGDRLEAKINAIRDGKTPPVDPVPGPEAHGPDGHPAELQKKAGE